MSEIFNPQILSRVDDFIEPMCRFIPAKYYFRVAGLGEIFARQKFLAIWYIVHVASLLCLHSVQGV